MDTTTSTSARPTPTTTPPPQRPALELDDAEATARAFAAALAASDTDGLARLAAERFSFDGDVQVGREAVRRSWGALLAGRPGPAPAVRDVQVLAAADAVEKHGKPPARLAPLVRPGVHVAVCDLGGRTVVLFLAREAGRMAVLGLSD